MWLETKTTEYLQSQTEIIQKPEYINFLKAFDKSSKDYEQRKELIKNNEEILWAMEKMIKPKIDLLLQKKA